MPERRETRQQQLDALLARHAPIALLKGRRRDVAAVRLRQSAIDAAFSAGFGAVEIAGALDRDRTTVSHYLRRGGAA